MEEYEGIGPAEHEQRLQLLKAMLAEAAESSGGDFSTSHCQQLFRWVTARSYLSTFVDETKIRVGAILTGLPQASTCQFDLSGCRLARRHTSCGKSCCAPCSRAKVLGSGEKAISDSVPVLYVTCARAYSFRVSFFDFFPSF